MDHKYCNDTRCQDICEIRNVLIETARIYSMSNLEMCDTDEFSAIIGMIKDCTAAMKNIHEQCYYDDIRNAIKSEVTKPRASRFMHYDTPVFSKSTTLY